VKTTVLIPILMIANLSWAQTTQVETIDKATAAQLNNSEMNRKDKKYQLNLILTGSGPTAAGSLGLSAGYFLEKNKMLLLEVTDSKTRFTKISITNADSTRTNFEETLKGQSIGVHYKQFNGNSFYLRTGLDYGKINYNFKYTPYGTNSTENVSLSGDALYANFQIGNQWQWENFTLGCDWVGISVPLYSHESDRSMNSFAQADESYYSDKLNTASSDFIKRSQINLLRFYLGATF